MTVQSVCFRGLQPDQGAEPCLTPSSSLPFGPPSARRRARSPTPAQIEDVVAGCVTQIGEQGFNIARTAALMAGFPIEVTGTTVNRQCGSSQQAFHFAAQAVMSGSMDAVVACGVESMTRIPMGSDSGMGMPNVAPAIPFSPMFSEHYNFVMQHESAE